MNNITETDGQKREDKKFYLGITDGGMNSYVLNKHYTSQRFTEEEIGFLRKIYGYGKYCRYIVDMNSIYEEHVAIEKLRKQFLPHSSVASQEVTWEWLHSRAKHRALKLKKGIKID